MQVLGTYLLAQRVALAQPLTHSRPASSTHPTTDLSLEVPNLEIRPASCTCPTTDPCSPNE